MAAFLSLEGCGVPAGAGASLGPLLVLACVGLAGCLYVDSINHVPVADLQFSFLPLTTPLLEHAVEFDASGSTDPDSGDVATLGFEWLVDGEVAMASAPSGLDAAAPPVDGGPSGPTYCFQTVGEAAHAARARVTFHVPGVHTVQVVAIDSHGARSAAVSAQLTVVNSPPSPMIDITTTRGGCGDFPASGPITMIAHATDVDSHPAGSPCYGGLDGETLSYYWHVVTRPTASKSAWLRQGECLGGPAGTPGTLEVPVGALMGSPSAQVVCLDPDVHGTYTVELLVFDGKGAMGSTRVDLAIADDRPPCMDGLGLDPPLGAYDLPRDQPCSLEVDDVIDDLDGSGTGRTRYAWSLWHDADPVWRPLNWADAKYTIADPSIYGIGELVRVRVQAGDRMGFPSTAQCADPSVDVCPMTDTNCLGTSNKPVECDAWATWDLRFR